MEDRREDSRILSMNPILLDTFERTGRAGVTEDLSPRGVRLRTTMELAVGTRVRVRMLSAESVLEATGTVVRQCPSQDASLFDYRCAVRLDQPMC